MLRSPLLISYFASVTAFSPIWLRIIQLTNTHRNMN